MIDELRCDGRMHARIDPDEGWIEVKCPRRACGAGPNVVVLHRFNLHTSKLVQTVRFASPRVREEANGTNHRAPAVRSA